MNNQNNNRLNQEIIKLKQKLKQYENHINVLSVENNNLKYQIQYLNNLINSQKYNTIQNNNFGGGNGKIIELMSQLMRKEEELNEIKSALQFDLKKGEKLMTLIFYSNDQKIHRAIICKNTETFCNIEQKLFKDYPELQEETYLFLVNGEKNIRYKTLEELKLKNSQVITMSNFSKE